MPKDNLIVPILEDQAALNGESEAWWPLGAAVFARLPPSPFFLLGVCQRQEPQQQPVMREARERRHQDPEEKL